MKNRNQICVLVIGVLMSVSSVVFAQSDQSLTLDRMGHKVVNTFELVMEMDKLPGLELSPWQRQVVIDARKAMNGKMVFVRNLWMYPELDPSDKEFFEKSQQMRIAPEIWEQRSEMANLAGQVEYRASLREFADAVLPSLNSEQKDVLRTLAFDEIVGGCTWGEVLGSANQLEGLQLSPEERARFAKAVQTQRREMDFEIAKLRRDAFEKSMKALPNVARDKIKRSLLIDVFQD